MRFPIDDEFIDSYKQKIGEGISFIQDKNICITGLARNIEPVLQNSLNHLSSICGLFNNCNVVIFENDSSDNTKNILQSWQQSNYYLISQNLKATHPTGSSKSLLRTTALANYRNICKNYIVDNIKTKLDYIIVIDLDFRGIDINGILNSFGWISSSNIDGIVGIAYMLLKDPFDKITILNYDSWAFRHTWWDDHQEQMPWFEKWCPFIGSQPIKVNSAFGGIGIYSADPYLSCNYDGYDCEHVCFHKNLYNKYPNFNLSLNPSQLFII
jgi:hypothetical protein